MIATVLGATASGVNRRFQVGAWRTPFVWFRPRTHDVAIECERSSTKWKVTRETFWPRSDTQNAPGLIYVSVDRQLRPKTWFDRLGVAPVLERWSAAYVVTNSERFGNAATRQDHIELMDAATSYLMTHRGSDAWACALMTNQAVIRVHWPGVGYNFLLLTQSGCILLMAAALLRVLVATRLEMTGLNRCPNCNYALIGLRDPVCPECGYAITLAVK